MESQEQDTSSRAPVGFNFHSKESFERGYNSLSGKSNRFDVAIPKETSYTSGVLKEINRVASNNEDKSFRVLLNKDFGKVSSGDRWKSNLTIDGKTYSSQAGSYSYRNLHSSLEEAENIKGSQFVLNDKIFSKATATQLEGLSSWAFENLSFLSYIASPFIDSNSSTLREKGSEVLINKFQFSEGKNPNVETKKWHEFMASDPEFNVELYKAREPRYNSEGEREGSSLRLLHSKYFFGKKDSKDWSYVYTQSEATVNIMGNTTGSSDFLYDLYYSTTHPKVKKELSEYHKQIKENSNEEGFETYEGDVVLGGGNLILSRFISDAKKAEGDIRVASASFQYNEVESEEKSRADKRAKELLGEFVDTLAKKGKEGNDVDLLVGRIGSNQEPREKSESEQLVDRLRGSDVEVYRPNYGMRTNKSPHFNLYMAEDIDESGKDVFYLTTRRLVGESHEEIALRITSEMDEKSYKRFRDLFDLLKNRSNKQYQEVRKELSRLSNLDNVKVEELSESGFLDQKITTEKIDKETEEYEEEIPAHPSVHRVMTTRIPPKFKPSAIEEGYKFARPLTDLPQSFYDTFREAPRLPKVNLYLDPDINEDLNKIPLKERINRWAVHGYSSLVQNNVPTFMKGFVPDQLRNPLIKKDETFLTGLLASFGHGIDTLSGHYEFQRHKLKVEGFYEATPNQMESRYRNPPELNEGPFENLFKGVTESISGITTAFISYGLFRGTSLLGAFMEDEMSRMIGQSSNINSNAISRVVKTLYIGSVDNIKEGKISEVGGRLSLGRIQAATRSMQAAFMDYAIGGALETIAFPGRSSSSQGDINRVIQDIKGNISEEPYVKKSDGTAHLKNVGRERIRELAKRWDKAAAQVPANMINWIPGIRNADKIDPSREASMADLIGRSLEGLLMTFERTTSRFGSFIISPRANIGKVSQAYRSSDELEKIRINILDQTLDTFVHDKGTISVQESIDEQRVQDYQTKYGEVNRHINELLHGDQTIGSDSVNVDVQQSANKKLFGVSVGAVRKGLLGSAIIFGSDYILSNILSGSGGLTLPDYLGYRFNQFFGEENDIGQAKNVPKDLPFWITSVVGGTGALATGWAFPKISHERLNLDFKYLSEEDRAYRDDEYRRDIKGDERYQHQRRSNKSVTQEQIDYERSKVASYENQPNKWKNIQRTTPRLRFNTMAGLVGFAFFSSAARIGSYLTGSGIQKFFDNKEDTFDAQNELAYLASQRIDTSKDPQNLAEKASYSIAEEFQTHLMQMTDESFESKFSIAFQFSIPLFQFTIVEDRIPDKGVRAYSFGFQTFPMLGSGVTPTFPIATRMFARPESQRPSRVGGEEQSYWGSFAYRLATLPSEFFTSVGEETSYESLLKGVGTFGVIGGLTNSIIPRGSRLREGMLGRGVRAASRVTMDLGSTVLSAPTLITDTIKSGAEDAMPDSFRKVNESIFGWGRNQKTPRDLPQGSSQYSRVRNVQSSYIRSSMPFLLAYLASTVMTDRNSPYMTDEFSGDGIVEEDKLSRLSTIGTLTAIYGGAIHGAGISYNPLVKPEVTYNRDRSNQVRAGEVDPNDPQRIPKYESDSGYRRLMSSIDQTDPVAYPKKPVRANYAARHIGRSQTIATRTMGAYLAGQLIGTIARGIFGDSFDKVLDHEIASGLRVWTGGQRKQEGYESVQNPRRVRRVIEQARGAADRSFLQRMEGFGRQIVSLMSLI